ncbi:hypothetical protein SH203_00888 [Brevundimonas sp. SH203]|nr:hypothetical protein [Brevundimonas sp. SH203]GAW40490.1 hypothetical protein SH203_00888 [Brevundimonas sp. SH203]
MTHPAMPRTELAAPRVMHPVAAYGLAALIGAAFWASLLVAIF